MRWATVGEGILPGIEIAFTHSAKKARKAIVRTVGEREANIWEDLKSSDAKTSCLFNPETGETRFLVYMRPCLDWGASEDAGILAHEAVHVAVGYLQSIGEDEPSEELRAYTVQCVTTYLAELHFKWKKKRLQGR